MNPTWSNGFFPTVKNFIIIGGDGTFNEAVNGFMKRKIQGGLKNINVGFLPGGTGNSFMHDLNGETYKKALKILNNLDNQEDDYIELYPEFEMFLH